MKPTKTFFNFKLLDSFQNHSLKKERRKKARKNARGALTLRGMFSRIRGFVLFRRRI
jgi:hypothetical protein